MLQRTAARQAWLLCAAILCVPAVFAQDAKLLHGLFTDHMVLQRDRPIRVWGGASAGDEITVTLAGATQTTRASGEGSWAVTLPAMPAGGPHTLAVRTAGRTQTAQDVMIGDVWLCSGQSNMEFSVRGAMNSRAEIAASADDGLRQVRIPRASSTLPNGGFKEALQWKVAGPDTTGDFSATCHFFTRELRKTLGVPQGVVVSAWGGSKIEPWMSEAAIREVGGYEAALESIQLYRGNETAGIGHWGRYWQQWWSSANEWTRARRPWMADKQHAAEWTRAPAELTPWETWGVPSLEKYDGMLWYRTHLALTPAQAKQARKSATLHLGVIDEVDLVFVNGRAVGSAPCCGERSYPLPPDVLEAGDNLVAVSVLDTYTSGGMYGPADRRYLQLADGTKLPLTGWEYLQPPGNLLPPRAPWEPTAGIAMLYNAMIAPLGQYGFRGVVWYQGESNTSVPEGRRYQAQLKGLMADWRRQFDSALPFLVVQLANYGPMAKAPVESGWALTRDAQRRAVEADGNAGLAVTIDIGNPDDVHPTNKQEVGRRLARAARHVVYGEKLSASGARPASAQRRGQAVAVSFADFEPPLVVYNSRDPAAFELCGAEAGTCRFVRAELRDGQVLLEDPGGAAPARVRYCWADSPVCNLYDAAGLPVGPFEIAIQ
ncbi:MAG TPA: sialate O-acetylesterase [Steroidobacteraceae bacterium]|jgi:sialate O-acetylesterase|nr:sialate O-acetylesterase [Steroidobacteraceae bacterium]